MKTALILATVTTLSLGGISRAAVPWAHWTMDQINDRMLADKQGNNNAILAQKPDFEPQLESGIKGNALSLVTAQQGFAAVEGGADLQFPGGLAITAWIKPDNRNHQGEIITCREDVPDAKSGWRLFFSYGLLIFEAVDAAGQTVKLSSAEDAIQADHWSHVGAVVEDNKVMLYINGSLVAEKEFNGPLAKPGNPPTALVIGNHATIAAWSHEKCPAYGGLLDEIKLFGEPISADEMAKEAIPPQ